MNGKTSSTIVRTWLLQNDSVVSLGYELLQSFRVTFRVNRFLKSSGKNGTVTRLFVKRIEYANFNWFCFSEHNPFNRGTKFVRGRYGLYFEIVVWSTSRRVIFSNHSTNIVLYTTTLLRTRTRSNFRVKQFKMRSRGLVRYYGWPEQKTDLWNFPQ